MRLTKSILSVLSALLIAATLLAVGQPPRSAEAHPLGNFSVNRLVLIDLDATEGIQLRYVVDTAELPTFQVLRGADRDGDGALDAAEKAAYLDTEAERLLGGLSLEIDGRRVALDLSAADVELLEGQAGLMTMRTIIDARGVLPEGWQDGLPLALEDGNFGGEPGWRQIVVRPGEGIAIAGEGVATVDVTRELTEYPKDLLSSPPAVSKLSLSLSAGQTFPVAAQPVSEAATVSREAANKTLGRFASIVASRDLTPGFVALALVLAAGWGAMHALGPGHGKTVVAAYLIGERGNWRHALYLGLIVTVTHTISVFALGAVAIFAADVLEADDLYNGLSVASGGLVAVLGACLLVSRGHRLVVSRRRTGQAHEHHRLSSHGHDHTHPHGHEAHEHTHHGEEHHGHSHVPAQPGWRGLLALGVSGGMVPCPTALVVMLGAIAIGRTVYGLVLVSAFSAGLAGVLTCVGLLMVYGGRLLTGPRLRPLMAGRLVRAVVAVSPLLSAVGILAAGILLTSQATL